MEQHKEIKLTFKGIVKRFSFPSSFKELLNTIYLSFPIIKTRNISVTYLDEEADLITISSDFDFENCRQYVKNSSITLVKVNVDCIDGESTFIEDIKIESNSKEDILKEDTKIKIESNSKEDILKEKKKDEAAAKDEPKKVCEENVMNIIQNSFQNVKDFVENNGGISNILSIFKDDVHNLKENFFQNLRGNGRRNHSRNNKNNDCEVKNKNKKETVDEFKNKLEKNLDKTFIKIKERLVEKMVKKYEKVLKKNTDHQPKSASNIVHQKVTCDGCKVFPIRGIRYKCTVCPDFDYCEKCEETVEHNHVFMKIKKPYNPLSYHINNGRSADPNRSNRNCHFFNNFRKFANPEEVSAKNKPEEVKTQKEESKPNEEEGYNFLVKEIKQTYELQLDDNIILEAVKKANGDIEQAMIILFS